MRVGYISKNGMIVGLRVVAESSREYKKCAEFMNKIDHHYCEHGYINHPTVSRMNEVCIFDWQLDCSTIPMRLEQGVWKLCNYEETGMFIDIGGLQ